MQYTEAENLPASELTVAQWARAQATKAVIATAPDLWDIAERVNALAELIITGSMPATADEVRKPCPACGRPMRLTTKSGVVIRHNDLSGALCAGSGQPPLG